MACKNCNGGCGDGKPGKATGDPVKDVLCEVFCESAKEWCEAKKKGQKNPRPSKIAEEKIKSPKYQSKLDNAIAKSGRYAKGAKAFAERRHVVPWNKKVPPSWRRKPMSPDRAKRFLKPIRDRVEREIRAKVAEVMAKKIAQKAATAWLKFIPVVNVISTAYDIYDIASTGYDLYKMVDDAMAKYSGSIFEIRPDVSIAGADGSLQDIYDFKFDGDSLNNNPGQKELYEEALDGRSPDIVDGQSCGCMGGDPNKAMT